MQDKTPNLNVFAGSYLEIVLLDDALVQSLADRALRMIW